MEAKITGSTKEDLREKDLNFRVDQLGMTDKMTFFGALTDERKRLSKETDNNYVLVPLEIREHILKLVSKNHFDREKIATVLKQDREFEKASKNGRPPIGGAIDD